MKKELNFIDKFLYKLFIGFLILTFIIVLDKTNLITLDNLKNELNKQINFLSYIEKINGSIEIIPLNINGDETVSYESYNIERIENGYKIKTRNYEAVENYTAGLVVQITQNKNDTYKIKIKSVNGMDFIYDQLSSHDCKMYTIYDTGQIIGKSSKNEENYFILSIEENGKEVLLFSDE